MTTSVPRGIPMRKPLNRTNGGIYCSTAFIKVRTVTFSSRSTLDKQTISFALLVAIMFDESLLSSFFTHI